MGYFEPLIGVVHCPHQDSSVQTHGIARQARHGVLPTERPMRHQLVLTADAQDVVGDRTAEVIPNLDRTVVGSGSRVTEDPAVR